MSGPPPKPTQLKKLHGNPGKRAVNTDEPQPERVAPAMPADLMEQAAQFWEAYAPKLEKLGLLTELDGLAFTMLSVHYHVAWQAMQILENQGYTDIDANGVERKHPLLQVLRDNSSLMLRYAKEFGMTPSARSRMVVGSPDEGADLADILAQAMDNL